MEQTLAYGFLILTIGIFGYIGYRATEGKDIEVDEHLQLEVRKPLCALH